MFELLLSSYRIFFSSMLHTVTVLKVHAMACSGEKLHHSMDAPKIMSLHLLKEITQDFSHDLELGSGKYGTVYKARISSSQLLQKIYTVSLIFFLILTLTYSFFFWW